MKFPTSGAHRDFVAFVVVGGTNTLVTWLFYVLLNTIMGYDLAYTLSYVLGIVLAYYMNTRWVFRVAMSWKTFFAFPLVYLVQYALGLGLLYLIVELTAVPEDLGPLVVTALTVPITFLMSRVVLARRSGPDDRPT